MLLQIDFDEERDSLRRGSSTIVFDTQKKVFKCLYYACPSHNYYEKLISPDSVYMTLRSLVRRANTPHSDYWDNVQAGRR